MANEKSPDLWCTGEFFHDSQAGGVKGTGIQCLEDGVDLVDLTLNVVCRSSMVTGHSNYRKEDH